MQAYTDHNRHFYLSPEKGVLLVRYPDVRFAPSWPKDLQQLPDEQVPRIVEGFLSVAEKRGGISLAIYYLKENQMAGSDKNVLVINPLLFVIGKFAMRDDAVKALAEGGALSATSEGAVIHDKDTFNALTVEQRCQIARPFLSEKEAPQTPDGEGFAKNAWKIANRFTMPKPAKEAKTAAADKPPKDVKPREKGVKTLIRELFTSTEGVKGKDGVDYAKGDELHLTVEEIMKAVDGTKSSVTTAISDLRSEKYCGKDAAGVVKTLTLKRVDGKYALEGSTAATEGAKRETEAAATAEQAKKDKKAADEAAKAAKPAEAGAETAGATA